MIYTTTGRSNYRQVDESDFYYTPAPYQRPGPPKHPVAASSGRHPEPFPQDTPYHIHQRHRDDRDAWSASGPDIVLPQPSRRQPSASTSDYGVRPLSRRERSSSASRTVRTKSSSPRRHAAPSTPQPSHGEREALARQRLRTTFETYVFNTLPTHLIRIADMTLVTRNEIWETFKPHIESPSDLHLARLVREQDEESGKSGISVIDPQLLAPFIEHVRSMINFAVFSHKWGNAEPLFHELPNKRLQTTRRSPPTGPGYQKLVKFCEKAHIDYGCEYAWTDTCCINKESSAELEEAILSMGVWYSEASICIVHLAQSSMLENFTSEPWFTRGWTLQELLLSRRIRLYGKNWSPICPIVAEGQREEPTGRDNRDEQYINDKDNESIVATIAKVTGIPEANIRHFVPGCTRVAEKMRWISQRNTSRIEDMAYSLLGLFDVTLPIAYGEGARAFYRLMSRLANECTEPDFFAWAGKASQWSLALPSSPQCYGPQAFPSDLIAPPSALGDPTYEFTKLGLRIKLVLVRAYCEPLGPTDAQMARFLLTPALATVQDPIQMHVPLASAISPHGPSQTYDQDYDLHEAQAGCGRRREYALGVVDFDARPGPQGYAALHAGRAHLCLVLERERRCRGWVRVARPGAVNVRFRESELSPVESVCLRHRA